MLISVMKLGAEDRGVEADSSNSSISHIFLYVMVVAFVVVQVAFFIYCCKCRGEQRDEFDDSDSLEALPTQTADGREMSWFRFHHGNSDSAYLVPSDTLQSTPEKSHPMHKPLVENSNRKSLFSRFDKFHPNAK